MLRGTCLLAVYDFQGNILAQNWQRALSQVFDRVIVLDIAGVGADYQRFLGKARNIMALEATTPLADGTYRVVHRRYPRNTLKSRVTLAHERDEAEALAAVRHATEGITGVACVFMWWGTGIVHNARTLKTAFPNAAVVWCIDGYPDTWASLLEYLERRTWKRYLPCLDGLVYYSDPMRKLFETALGVNDRPGIVMMEPFLSAVFADETPPRTDHLVPGSPNVVFIGRADRLYARDPRIRKDAVGYLLEGLAARRVTVHVASNAGLRLGSRLVRYPYFRNAEIFDGTFARFLSSFDANLAIYNEQSLVMRQQSALGLSTRFALALAARAPIAVSESAAFARDLFRQHAFGFTFSDIPDLARKLHDRGLMADLKSRYPDLRPVFSFEACRPRLEAFLRQLVTTHRQPDERADESTPSLPQEGQEGASP